ncbi:MAG TPA: LamG-like jellyroll fold domain-containing protein, partial [Phycisphaerae bacterium]|nr:LamG-like jellyroll fold domain-containing protein [Phycisphaerae bacterium]
ILTMGTWYHIMGVYNESGHWIKTYVNGKLDRYLQGDGTGTGQTDIPVNALGSTTGNFVMGKEPWTSLYFFNGWMDDIRVWNRILTDNDAKTLYDTTISLHSSVAGGTIANFADMTVSIPTPAAPTIPAITTLSNYTATNVTVNGDLSVKGNVTSTTGSSVVGGNLNYSGSFPATTHLTVQGKTNGGSSIAYPNVDFTYLHDQATNWGKVVSSSSNAQTYTFNSLGGNKVIWIKGDLTDPAVTISGTYAAGGTFVVDGDVNITANDAKLGADGYPVYIVASGDINITGNNFTLIGCLYAPNGTINHKTCTISGPVVGKNILNNASGASMFTTTAIPWFDNRALPQPPALPLYTAAHRGIGP